MKPEQTYRKGLGSLLDHKALDEVGEDLRFDHRLGDGCSVPVPMAASGERQGQGEGGRRLEAGWSRGRWRGKKIR